jgi:hypothetical protein
MTCVTRPAPAATDLVALLVFAAALTLAGFFAAGFFAAAFAGAFGVAAFAIMSLQT